MSTVDPEPAYYLNPSKTGWVRAFARCTLWVLALLAAALFLAPLLPRLLGDPG